MKLLTRLMTASALIMFCASSPLAAQGGRNPFSWYFGASGGVLIFETPRQQRGGMPTAGANMMITAKRTALMLSVEEGIGNNEQSSYVDATAPGGSRNVTFNDIRKYSAVLMAFPLKSHAQPFVGLGGGIMHIHNPQPQNTLTPAERSRADSIVTVLGSHGYGTFVAGLQLQVSGVAVYGMYQFTSGPDKGKLLIGPTHTLTAGLRVSIGSAKEGVTGGGY
ncbi:MAG: hypothetical protein ABI836_12360 [Gemmatimonadota bacterium]